MLLALGISLTWLLVIEAIIIFVCIAAEKEWMASVSIVLFLVACHFLAGVPVLQLIQDNWAHYLKLAGIYLAVGTVWSFAKWFFFVRNVKDSYVVALRESKVDVIKLNNERRANKRNRVGDEPLSQEEILEQEREIIRDACSTIKREFDCSVPPQANEMKGSIIGWISYWPMSIIWTLLDDFLTKIFRQIYSTLAGTFQRISDSQFKEFDLEKK